MSEWWTYSLSDFLMFSSRSYFRLIENYNAAIWPAHLLALVAGVVVIGCTARPGRRAQTTAALLLAAAWGWVGWAYQLERYADINTAAPYFGAAFALQALVLCWLAAKPGVPTPARMRNRVALGIVGLAVLAFPAMALAGRGGWRQAELFGITPDPTVAATLGALLAWRAQPVAWLIPVAWCVVSGATLMEMRVQHALLLPAIAIFSIAVGVTRARQSRGST